MWSRVTFPSLKISNIPKKWPKIVDFGLFQCSHSNPHKIYSVPSWVISISNLWTLPNIFGLIWSFVNDLDVDLYKPLFCNLCQIQEELDKGPLWWFYRDTVYIKNPNVSSQYDLIFSIYGQNKKMASDFAKLWNNFSYVQCVPSILGRKKYEPLIYSLSYINNQCSHFVHTILPQTIDLTVEHQPNSSAIDTSTIDDVRWWLKILLRIHLTLDCWPLVVRDVLRMTQNILHFSRSFHRSSTISLGEL